MKNSFLLPFIAILDLLPTWLFKKIVTYFYSHFYSKFLSNIHNIHKYSFFSSFSHSFWIDLAHNIKPVKLYLHFIISQDVVLNVVTTAAQIISCCHCWLQVMFAGIVLICEHSVQVRRPGIPAIHLGRVASGAAVVKDEQARQTFSAAAGVAAYDSDYDAVIEAVYGSRIDSYAFIRGIADYVNGSRGKDWQPYAALVAASFMKEIILHLPKPSIEDD